MIGTSTADQPFACMNVNSTPAVCDSPGERQLLLTSSRKLFLTFFVLYFNCFSAIEMFHDIALYQFIVGRLYCKCTAICGNKPF